MTSSPILILGGAGKTGRRVAPQLGARGVAFRLASRSSEPRVDWYDEFAVIRNHRSEYVSDGVGRVLGRQPRDFTDWARATAEKGAWPVQPPMGQASHDFSDDAVTVADAGLVQAES